MKFLPLIVWLSVLLQLFCYQLHEDVVDEGCGCSLKTGREGNADISTLQRVLTANKNNRDNRGVENMVYLVGGSGFIGTDKPIIHRDGEGPRRSVTLSPYYLDKYEVSNDGKRVPPLCFPLTDNV